MNDSLNLLGKYIAIDFETGKVRDYDGVVQITIKPNIVELTPHPTAVFQLDVPDTTAPSYSQPDPITAIYGTPVLGSHLDGATAYTTTLNDTPIDQQFGIWYEVTDRFGNPVNPYTNQPQTEASGTITRYYIQEGNLASVKAIHGYAPQAPNEEKS